MPAVLTTTAGAGMYGDPTAAPRVSLAPRASSFVYETMYTGLACWLDGATQIVGDVRLSTNEWHLQSPESRGIPRRFASPTRPWLN